MKNKTSTPDIYFAAAMIALGAKHEDTDKSDPRHMKFVLSQTPPVYQFQSVSFPETSNMVGSPIALDFDYYERQWTNGSLMVNAVAFKNAIQGLKTVVHSS